MKQFLGYLSYQIDLMNQSVILPGKCDRLRAYFTVSNIYTQENICEEMD